MSLISKNRAEIVSHQRGEPSIDNRNDNSEDLEPDPDYPPPPDESDTCHVIHGSIPEVESTSSALSDFDINHLDSEPHVNMNIILESSQPSRKRKRQHQTADRTILLQGVDAENSDGEVLQEQERASRRNRVILFYGRKC